MRDPRQLALVRQDVQHHLLDVLGAPRTDSSATGIALNINGRLEELMRGGDPVSLRQAGDLMQSSLSRIAEFVNERVPRDGIPYEVRMALLEAAEAIEAWTAARSQPGVIE
jgi:hypothetical protein